MPPRHSFSHEFRTHFPNKNRSRACIPKAKWAFFKFCPTVCMSNSLVSFCPRKAPSLANGLTKPSQEGTINDCCQALYRLASCCASKPSMKGFCMVCLVGRSTQGPILFLNRPSPLSPDIFVPDMMCFSQLSCSSCRCLRNFILCVSTAPSFPCLCFGSVLRYAFTTSQCSCTNFWTR